MDKKFLKFDIESADIVDEDPNSQFAIAKIQAFSSDANRHELYCSEETLKNTASTIYDKPILYNVDRAFNDFGSHTDADKSLIAGFVVPNSAEFVRLPDDRLSLVVLAKLWKRYAPKVIEFFKDTARFSKKCSVEMELYDSAPMASGLTEMKDFAYFGICLLGDLITEASPGAHAEILSFAKENTECRNAYLAEFSKYDGLDLSIPNSIKTNVDKALSLHKTFGRGGNSVVLAHARHLQKNSHVSPERVKSMAKLLTGYAKREVMEDDENPSNEYISYLALGGKEGFKWACGLAKSIEEIDSQKLSYFGDNMEEFAKDNMGKGEALKVDKSKEALSNKSWGSIDKTALRNRILEASNYKSLVHDCYMVVESGWEDSPSSALKYPVMCIVSGSLVYNAGGLSSALGYAKAEGDNAVVSKVENIRRKMGLESDGDNKNEKKEVNNSMDEKEKKEDVEEKKENPEEEKTENPKDEKKEEEKEDKSEEKKEEKMSLDAYLDVAAMLSFLEDETENYKQVAEAEFAKPEGERNNFAVMGAMFSKMKKLTEMCNKMSVDKADAEKKFADMKGECEKMAAENEELKKFKADVEREKFSNEVAATMSEVKENMPKEEYESLFEKSKEFSLENIDAFKNLARAKAFEFSKGKKKDSDGITRIGLIVNENNDKKSGSVWDRISV